MQPLEYDNIRLAATVMLIKDSSAGLQVYMVQRNAGGAFPNLHVFPGGKVDDADFAPDLTDGLSDDEASALLGVSAGGLRYWVAVARECFEECGVLVARNVDLSSPVTRGRYAAYREQLLADEISFADICIAESLKIETDLLGYFSHWITPESAPRRFDTRFFVAAMPPGQQTNAYTGETTDDDWVTPEAALAKFRSSEWQLIDPTLRSLETLSNYHTVNEVLAGVRRGDHLMPLTPELNRQGMQTLR